MVRIKIAITLLMSVICSVCQAATLSEAECENQANAVLTLFQLSPSKSTEQKFLSYQNRLEEWAATYPDNARIRFAAGTAQMLSGDNAKSVEHLKTAYNSSGDAQIGFTYSLVLKINRQPTQAIAVIRELVTINPNLPQLRIALAMSLKGVQQYLEAYEILTASKRQVVRRPNEDYAVLLESLGECELYLGKHDQAIATLNDADSYLPDSARIVQSLSEALLKSNRTDDAEFQLHRALKLNESMPETHYCLGLILEGGDANKARSHFERALMEGEKRMKINSDNGSDHYLLYLVCEKLGKNEEAEEYKKTAAELHYTYEAPWKKSATATEEPK